MAIKSYLDMTGLDTFHNLVIASSITTDNQESIKTAPSIKAMIDFLTIGDNSIGATIDSIQSDIENIQTALEGKSNTDEKVKSTVGNTTKAYLVGSTSNVETIGTLVKDTNVYLDTTAGKLVATTFSGSLSGNASSSSQVKTVTRSTNATHYVSFVDSNNSSATNENVYTNADLTYNPNTKTLSSTTFSGALSGNASSASKLSASDAGDANKPVYFSNGVPVAIGYTIDKSVPSNAVFTDTTYTIATGTANGKIKVTPSSGTAYEVAVKGLGSAAYTDSSAYASANSSVTVGNSTISLGGTATLAEIGAVSSSTYNTFVENTNNTLATKANTSSLKGGAYKEVDTSINANSTSTKLPTSQAVASFVDSRINTKIAAADAMIYKGTIGSSSTSGVTITALPTKNSNPLPLTGWTYKVATAGTYASQKCEVGDMIVCLTDATTTTDPTWTVIQSNIDGAVTSSDTSSISGKLVMYSGTTGRVITGTDVSIGTTTLTNSTSTISNDDVVKSYIDDIVGDVETLLAAI